MNKLSSIICESSGIVSKRQCSELNRLIDELDTLFGEFNKHYNHLNQIYVGLTHRYKEQFRQYIQLTRDLENFYYKYYKIIYGTDGSVYLPTLGINYRDLDRLVNFGQLYHPAKQFFDIHCVVHSKTNSAIKTAKAIGKGTCQVAYTHIENLNTTINAFTEAINIIKNLIIQFTPQYQQADVESIDQQQLREVHERQRLKELQEGQRLKEVQERQRLREEQERVIKEQQIEELKSKINEHIRILMTEVRTPAEFFESKNLGEQLLSISSTNTNVIIQKLKKNLITIQESITSYKAKKLLYIQITKLIGEIQKNQIQFPISTIESRLDNLFKLSLQQLNEIIGELTIKLSNYHNSRSSTSPANNSSMTKRGRIIGNILAYMETLVALSTGRQEEANFKAAKLAKEAEIPTKTIEELEDEVNELKQIIKKYKSHISSQNQANLNTSQDSSSPKNNKASEAKEKRKRNREAELREKERKATNSARRDLHTFQKFLNKNNLEGLVNDTGDSYVTDRISTYCEQLENTFKMSGKSNSQIKKETLKYHPDKPGGHKEIFGLYMEYLNRCLGVEF